MRINPGAVPTSSIRRFESQPAPSDTRTPIAPFEAKPRDFDQSLSSFETTQQQKKKGPQQSKKPPQVNDPKDDTVAIFDNGGVHSQNVEFILRANSGTTPSEVRQTTISGGGGYTPNVLTTGPEAAKKLQEHIESRAVSMLRNTSKELKAIDKEPGNLRVINQSMRTSPAFLAVQIWNPSDPVSKLERKDGAGKKYPVPAKNKEDREKLAVALGMDLAALRAAEAKKYTDAGKKPDKGKIDDALKHAVLQRLVNHVTQVIQDSKLVKEAKQEFDGLVEKLEKDHGILYVVASGNDGTFLKELGKEGITYGDAFTDSVFFNERAIVVAASTGGPSIADFSTPNNSVDMATDGTDIQEAGGKSTGSGTSYAAPQVAALITDLRGMGLTPAQVRTVLADPRIYTDTKALPAQEGAGILKPGEAKKVARELLKQQQEALPAPKTVSLLSLPRMLRG
jgi:hypothetical protein